MIQRDTSVLRYVWVTSARDQYAATLLDAIRPGSASLPQRLLSEPGPCHEAVEARATSLGVPFILLPERVSDQTSRLSQLLEDIAPTFVVLVGYMQKVPRSITDRWICINLHPAPPYGPIGAWQDVTWSLIATQAQETGTMLHIATDRTDRGPIVSYCTLRLDGVELQPLWNNLREKVRAGGGLAAVVAREGSNEPLFREIRRMQFQTEVPLLAATFDALSRVGTLLSKEGVILDNASVPAGLCLSDDVSNYLRERHHGALSKGA